VEEVDIMDSNAGEQGGANCEQPRTTDHDSVAYCAANHATGTTIAGRSADTPPVQRLLRWLARHPISRAGAAAVALSGRRRRPGAPLHRRWLAQISGSVLVALGVSITLSTGIGAGSLDVLNVGLADRTGLPLGVAVWIVAGALIATAALLGGRPRAGTYISPFVIGAVLQPLVAFWHRFLVEPPLVVAVPVHLAGIVMIGFGAGAVVVAGFGSGTAELLTDAVVSRIGNSPVLIRLGFEVTWLTAGVLLGGPAGLGTVLMATLIGPAVSRGVQVVEPLVAGPTPARLPAVSDRPPGSPSRTHRRPGAPEEVRALAHR
jgi:uncharacterized membrane protein YczE